MLDIQEVSTHWVSHPRTCPLCGGVASGLGYPYSTEYNSIKFKYQTCGGCKTVFVDPVPDAGTFTKMYAHHSYHHQFYKEDNDLTEYRESAALLTKYLASGARVLDYGCGMGHFLIALREQGFKPFGVEFDPGAARASAQRTDCEIFTVDDFMQSTLDQTFDAIHLGDVLEHLPDPAATLCHLLGHLGPGGLLYAEGPLERNASPVFWVRSIIGAIKHLANPSIISSHPPTHLYFTGPKQQHAFFSRVSPSLVLLEWEVFETGWPYQTKGVKRLIAAFAKKLGGKTILNKTFGNRFRGVFAIQS